MKVKKLLAIGLTVAMFLSAGSQALVDASSQEGSSEQQVSVSKSTVQQKSFNANATSGNCGDSMTWSYNESTGVLTISGSGTMTSHPWDQYNDTISRINFSGDITSIYAYAFSDCSNIETVTVPSSVKIIGRNAFSNCINLTTIQIGNNVKTINEFAFSNCVNLEKIILPDSVESLGDCAFSGCSNLKSVKLSDNLLIIGQSAFKACKKLSSIVIPASVEKIKSFAFEDAVSMTSVTFGSNSNLLEIGSNVFRGCSSIKTISLPDKLEKISMGAFSDCTGLEVVSFGKNVITIDDDAFSKCYSLKNLTFPESLVNINSFAFSECKNLKSIKFNSGLKKIGSFAFESCSSITSLFIPSTVTTIGQAAFWKLNKLTSVVFDNNSNLTSLGTSGFSGCSELKSIVLPDKMDGISMDTFSECTNLEEVIIGKHVVSISKDAFWKCTKLKIILIPKSVTTISHYAFSGCTSLNTVKYTGSESKWKELKNNGINANGNEYLLNAPKYIFNYGAEISSISIKTKPKKLSYTVGEKLNTTGLVLNVNYEDGSGQTVDEGFTCSPSVLNTVGNDQKVTVTYKGKTAIFSVSVSQTKKTVKSISIASKPSKLTYKVGETLNTDGLKLLITYSDGSTATVTSGFTCTPTKLSTAGTQKITVNYNDKSTSFNVTVNKANKTVKSIKIKSKPTKLKYKTGEKLNTKGLKLTVTYTDKSTATITSGFTCSPTNLSKAGTQKITVNYNGKTASFNVTVNQVKKTVKSIKIGTKPTKLKYKVGEKLNTNGLKLTVTYTDNSTATVTSGFTCSPTKLSKAGTKKITVKYKGKTTSFNVTVSKVVKSIKIKSKPSKLKYKTGETLNTNGLKLTVTYTDKSTKTISSGFTCSPTAFTKVGTQKITVKYGGKSASFNVTVSKGKTTSNTLPKLTNDNVAKELEKQLRWHIGIQNQFAGRVTIKGFFVVESSEIYMEYYQAMDYKKFSDYANDIKKYIVIDDKTINSLHNYKVKNNKLYIGFGARGGSDYDIKSVRVKEYKNGEYLIEVDEYDSLIYYTTYTLRVIVENNQYKIVYKPVKSYEKKGMANYDASEHPNAVKLVSGAYDYLFYEYRNN